MNNDLHSNYYRIEKAIEYLTANFRSQPSLDLVADQVSLSPFHFQRMFLDWVGLSPKKFVQYLTVNYLKPRIGGTGSLIEAASLAGLSSQSRVYDLFINIEGVSPQQYKSAGMKLEIVCGYHDTPFGKCFIAATERGICELRFTDETASRKELGRLRRNWHSADIRYAPGLTRPLVGRIFNPASVNPEKLKLLVQGSEFQIKVWEALLQIPFGEFRTYGAVAQAIKQLGAVRQVASAAGQNPISYLIPCHRIICKNRSVGNFVHGKVRKQALLSWEIATRSIKLDS
ncbi:6-O-methylguanine DNA methyltransferase [Pedobacter yulinensis]|uniref:6-O-methylguanine DNA methyltransferase n=1 Tax=Pedobacter yulinensis TaxID=2126353 RepID=A0A2T3HJF8_9SPHI|nr:methylated-DNA--[protein]-cysteine S-methyltransferase [Pedobacter yulinensis]PST82570.1 6-O-methylguanine DNA methyltransferase [Pedobacter yulinensis]